MNKVEENKRSNFNHFSSLKLVFCHETRIYIINHSHMNL